MSVINKVAQLNIVLIAAVVVDAVVDALKCSVAEHRCAMVFSSGNSHAEAQDILDQSRAVIAALCRLLHVSHAIGRLSKRQCCLMLLYCCCSVLESPCTELPEGCPDTGCGQEVGQWT